MVEKWIPVEEVKAGDEIRFHGAWHLVEHLREWFSVRVFRIVSGGYIEIDSGEYVQVRRKEEATPMKHHQTLPIAAKDLKKGDEIVVQDEWRESEAAHIYSTNCVEVTFKSQGRATIHVRMMSYPADHILLVRRASTVSQILVEDLVQGDVVVNLGGLPLAEGLKVQFSTAGLEEGWFLEFETPRPFPLPPFLPRISLPLRTPVEVLR